MLDFAGTRSTHTSVASQHTAIYTLDFTSTRTRRASMYRAQKRIWDGFTKTGNITRQTELTTIENTNLCADNTDGIYILRYALLWATFPTNPATTESRRKQGSTVLHVDDASVQTRGKDNPPCRCRSRIKQH